MIVSRRRKSQTHFFVVVLESIVGSVEHESSSLEVLIVLAALPQLALLAAAQVRLLPGGAGRAGRTDKLLPLVLGPDPLLTKDPTQETIASLGLTKKNLRFL